MNHIRVGDLTHGPFWREPNRVLFYGGNINPSQLAVYARLRKMPSFFASSDLQEPINSPLCGDTPFLTVAAGVLQNHQSEITRIFKQHSIAVPPIFESFISDPVDSLYDIEVVKSALGEDLTGVVYAQDPLGLFIRNGEGIINRVLNSGPLKISQIHPYIYSLVKTWIKDKNASNNIIKGLMDILSSNLIDGRWVHEVFLEQLRQDGKTIPEDNITFTLNHELAEIYFEQRGV